MGISVGAEERGPRLSSDRDDGIYRLAVTVLKKNLKFGHFIFAVVQGRRRNAQKIVIHVQSCCFAN